MESRRKNGGTIFVSGDLNITLDGANRFIRPKCFPSLRGICYHERAFRFDIFRKISWAVEQIPVYPLMEKAMEALPSLLSCNPQLNISGRERLKRYAGSHKKGRGVHSCG